MVIFKAPPLDDTDYIKRVIGLPGDQVQMIGGVLHLNGMPVQKQRVADFVLPISPNTHCYSPSSQRIGEPMARAVCRYPRYPRNAAGRAQLQRARHRPRRPQDNTTARRRARRPAVPDGRQPRQFAWTAASPPCPGRASALSRRTIWSARRPS